MPDQYYKVAIDDYLADDPMGFDFSRGKNRSYLLLTVRDLLLEELRHIGKLTGESPNNITLVPKG